MQRTTFLKAITQYHVKVVKKMQARLVTLENAEEAVQNAVTVLLEKKAYQKLDFEAIDGRVFKFIAMSAKSELSHMRRREEMESKVMVSIVENEPEQFDLEQSFNREESLDCPFCFGNSLDLTMYNDKVCASCSTILGQGKFMRQHVSIEEDELFEYPNLDLKIDVQQAMKLLTPLEQRVVTAVVNNHDTLDGIADAEGMTGRHMFRIYADAKAKLKSALCDYATTKS